MAALFMSDLRNLLFHPLYNFKYWSDMYSVYNTYFFFSHFIHFWFLFALFFLRISFMYHMQSSMINSWKEYVKDRLPQAFIFLLKFFQNI